MSGNKFKFYLFTSCLLIVSWSYIGYKWFAGFTEIPIICWFKKITHIPCPGCGITRNILALINNQEIDIYHSNPLGIVALIVSAILLLLVISDGLLQQTYTYSLYLFIEKKLRQPKWLLPTLVLLLANWVWNITKGL